MILHTQFQLIQKYPRLPTVISKLEFFEIQNSGIYARHILNSRVEGMAYPKEIFSSLIGNLAQLILAFKQIVFIADTRRFFFLTDHNEDFPFST